MNITICDRCEREIRSAEHQAKFRFSIFNMEEKVFDLCNDCAIDALHYIGGKPTITKRCANSAKLHAKSYAKSRTRTAEIGTTSKPPVACAIEFAGWADDTDGEESGGLTELGKAAMGYIAEQSEETQEQPEAAEGGNINQKLFAVDLEALKYFKEGLDVDQIAALLDRTPRAVKMMQSRLRRLGHI